MGPIVGGIKLDAKVYGTSLKDFPEKNQCIVLVGVIS